MRSHIIKIIIILSIHNHVINEAAMAANVYIDDDNLPYRDGIRESCGEDRRVGFTEKRKE